MPYYRYSNRQYKRKKYQPSDLELLGYTSYELTEAITRVNKKITCSKCLNETDLNILIPSELFSGQYGIYFKCAKCQKNVSISTKLDFDKDRELNRINESIQNFNALIKKAQKEYNIINSLEEKIKKELILKKKNLSETISKKTTQASKINNEVRDCCLTYEEDTSILRFLSEATGLKTKEHVDLLRDGQTYSVKKTHIDKFKDLSKKYKGIYVEIRKLEDDEKFADVVTEKHFEERYRESFNFISNSCHRLPYDKKKNLVSDAYKNLDPNNRKDLEEIEEHHLKPLLKKRDQRILLLKRIFRTSKGNVYILESDAMPGFYKVGWTERSAEERAKELSGTALPSPYRVLFSQSTNLTGNVEKEIHKILDEFRHRSNREFFKGDLKMIKKTIKEALTN